MRRRISRSRPVKVRKARGGAPPYGEAEKWASIRVAMAGLKIALPLYGESLIYKLRAQMLTRRSRRIDTDAVRGYESLVTGRRSDMRVPSPVRLLASTLPSWASAMVLAMASPRPEPPSLEDLSPR
jgi:hypothetical protein